MHTERPIINTAVPPSASSNALERVSEVDVSPINASAEFACK